jgi:hypothetical protein
MAAGIEPTEPWHPEIYRMHREVAVAETAEKAIALAKQKASTDLLAERTGAPEPQQVPASA